LLLPVIHFLVAFTLPEQLRRVARAHQKTVYNILFRASSKALLKLAADPRFVGARIGIVGVLHTQSNADSPDIADANSATPERESPRCSNCGGPLILVRSLIARRREPP
jgi:hypothetical protein